MCFVFSTRTNCDVCEYDSHFTGWTAGSRSEAYITHLHFVQVSLCPWALVCRISASFWFLFFVYQFPCSSPFNSFLARGLYSSLSFPPCRSAFLYVDVLHFFTTSVLISHCDRATHTACMCGSELFGRTSCS
jgi:hypothetical protein